EANHVADKQVPLKGFREVPTVQNLRGRAGACSLRVDFRGLGMFLILGQESANQGTLIGIGTGSIVDDVVAPGIEDVSVRVREPIGRISRDLERARIEPPNARILVPN